MSDLCCCVHKDRVLDGVGLKQPNCNIIFCEYVWGSRQRFLVKDDLLLPMPLFPYPNIFHDSVIPAQSYKASFSGVSTFNYSQNMWNAIFSFECRKDKSFLPGPPNISSYIYMELDGEIYHFSLSPLYNSSYREDSSIHDLKLSDCGCRDLFVHSYDHDFGSSSIDLTKPLTFYDTYYNELETPQAIEELHTELMVMASSHI